MTNVDPPPFLVGAYSRRSVLKLAPALEADTALSGLTTARATPTEWLRPEIRYADGRPCRSTTSTWPCSAMATPRAASSSLSAQNGEVEDIVDRPQIEYTQKLPAVTPNLGSWDGEVMADGRTPRTGERERAVTGQQLLLCGEGLL